MKQTIKHSLMTLAAIVFLIEAWLWDKTILISRWLVKILPWAEFKRSVATLISKLPAYGALALFVIPVIVVEPLKIIAISQIARGNIFRGILAFVVLKFVGLGLIAFIFDLTREKLLTIGWFWRFYDFVIRWRIKAGLFLAPYKAAVRTRIVELKRFLNISETSKSIVAALMRLRNKIRNKQA